MEKEKEDIRNDIVTIATKGKNYCDRKILHLDVLIDENTKFIEFLKSLL